MTACFLVAGSGVALDSPNCRFTIQEGRDDWACVSGWRTYSGDGALGRVPTKSDKPAIDVAARIASGTAAFGSRLTVGSRNAAGTVSSLVVEEGATYDTLYGQITIGDAAGATGVVHFAGGSLPNRLDSYNGTSNTSYLVIGNEGAGFVTNSHGVIYLRESCRLGLARGSFGRYVHENGTLTFSFGNKPFAVGVEGRGELNVTSGTLSLQDLLIGGTNGFDNVARVRNGATLAFNARTSIGGYTNRMDKNSREYPCGRGVLKLEGGRLLSRSSENPTVKIGCYPTASGEIRGWGSLEKESSKNLRLALGHGRIVADGGVLDCSAVTSLTHAFVDSAAGWYAVNGGEVKFPSVSTSSPTDVLLGLSSNMVNSVRVTETGAAASTHVFSGGVCAADCEGLPPLPYNRAVLGVVKVHDAASFASASVAVKYDPAAVPAASEVALYRLEGGDWRRIAKTAVTPNGVITAVGVVPAADGDGAPSLPWGASADGDGAPSLPWGASADGGGAPSLPLGASADGDGAPSLPGGAYSVGVFAVLAVGETLNFRPAVTTGSSSSNPYWDWSSAQNWVKRDGVTTKKPAEGDEIEVNVKTNGIHAANLSSYVAGIRLGSTIGNVNFSHSGFRLLGGGEGMVSAVDGGQHTMWTSWYFDGDARVNVTSSFNVTGSFLGRSATRPGRLTKLGPGAITCATGGVHWTGATIHEGAFTMKGSTQRGLEFRFAGHAPSAYFALSNNLELADGVLSSSSDLPRTKHGFNDFNRAFTLALTGSAAVRDQYFCGGLQGATSFRFAPDATSASFTFARAESTTTGSITVERGMVRFTDGAVFTNLNACVLSSASARLEADGASRLAFRRLDVAAGAKVRVASGDEIAVPVGGLVVAGVALPYGVYATNAVNGSVAVDWLEGGGVVCVGGGHAKEPATQYLAQDGWYEFGNPNWTTSASPWYSTMALPDFSRLYFPSGARVRFVGGILFDSFPEGVATFDWSRCTGFGVVSPAAFRDRAIVVPSGCRFWYMPCAAISLSGGTVTRTLCGKPAEVPLPQDVEMNGTWSINDTTGSIVCSGRLSGSGTIEGFNFYKTFTHTGAWAFTGTLNPKQSGNDCILRPTASAGKLASLKIGGSYNGTSSYTPTLVSWNPVSSSNPVLSIQSVAASEVGGYNVTNGFRYGAALSTYGNGEIAVGSLKTVANKPGKGLHLLADSSVNSTTRTQTGRGRFTVGEIKSASYLHLYDAVDFTVTNILAASTFDFGAETNVVNSGTFAVKGTCPSTCQVVADSPQQLPAELPGYTGEVKLNGRIWRLILDFDDVAACARTIGADWQYGATGTVVVVWTKGTPAPGRHRLLSFPASSPLADASKWKMKVETGRSSLFSVVRTSTALDVEVPDAGFPLSFYVDSENGDDAASGIFPQDAWRSLDKVNTADIRPGERVLFKRGGLWRGQLRLKSGEPGRRLFYGAYGDEPRSATERRPYQGDTLPIIQGSADARGAGAWTAYASGIWRSRDAYDYDVGNIIVDHGVTNGWKKWKLEKCVNVWDFLYDRDDHHVYLRHPSNPGTACSSLELALDRHVVSHASCHDVTVDSLAVRYGAAHGFGGGSTRRVVIQNCEISWIGGGVLGSEIKSDGSITRYGNGIEFWGASESNVVTSNRLWEIYDAALTDQSETGDHTNLVWSYNVVWNAEYAYEHFNRSADYSVSDITVAHNTFVDSGHGWANVQRPDPNSAPLMIWYSDGPVARFDIRDNVFAFSRQQGVRMTTDWHTRVTLRNNLWWLEDEAKLFRLVNAWHDFAGLVSLGLGDGSAFADPLFRDASAHDYRLRRESPARGLATDGGTVGAYPLPSLSTLLIVK